MSALPLQKLESILEQMPFLIWIFSESVDLVFQSDLAVQYQGSLPKLKALARRAQLARTNKLQVKMRLQDMQSNERWMLISLHTLSDSSYGMLALDIQDQVENEEKAEEQKVAVENSARMATLGQLSAGIAHEINNPLAVMTSKAFQVKRSLLQKNFSSQSKEIQDLEKIEKTGFRIASIIKGLRTLARDSEKDQFESVLLSDIVADVLLMFEEKLRKSQIHLKLDFPPNLRILCRPSQICQILLNLLGNSVDALNSNSEKWIRLEGKREGRQALISVTDSGSGIPLELAERIMNPFFTTKSAGKGTGLGLSISRKLARDHGGDLVLNSNSQNTQFQLILPESGD